MQLFQMLCYARYMAKNKSTIGDTGAGYAGFKCNSMAACARFNLAL